MGIDVIRYVDDDDVLVIHQARAQAVGGLVVERGGNIPVVMTLLKFQSTLPHGERGDGMAGALLATGLAQALATVMAITVEKHPDTLEILMLNGFFIAVWVGSAVLFRWAGACSL